MATRLAFAAPDFLPELFTTDHLATLVLIGAVVGLLVSLCEEVGWTPFAIPRLREHRSVLATGLSAGLGEWHPPLFYWLGGDAGELALDRSLPAVLFCLAVLPTFRVLVVWGYDRTGNLLAVLMHASLNGGIPDKHPACARRVAARSLIFRHGRRALGCRHRHRRAARSAGEAGTAARGCLPSVYDG